MIKKYFLTISFVFLAFVLASCTYADKRVAGYGAGGAAVGALAGSAIKNNTKGVLTGAAIGAATGTLVGAITTSKGEQYCNYRDSYGRIYQAPCN